MKISYNWLLDYLAFEESPQRLGEILTEIGLEVEGLEKVESIPGGLAGIITGEVRSVEPHPNADRLQKTTVDIGQPELLHIVCGAPNVAEGQKVLVAQPGTTLHPTEGIPFKIKKSKIRGEVSEGMICAEDEIGLGTNHDGITVLAPDTDIGKSAAEVYSISTDYVYDIGLTPNRSDATSHLGVARDLAAALTYIHKKPFRINQPDVSGFHADSVQHEIGVIVEDDKLCPRYSSLTVSDLKLGPSPQWMVDRLRAIGVRPINNVVDITNFILHETGQPLHAFDLRALKGSHVHVKCLEKDTPFTTLDEVERKLTAEDLMICNASQEPMCIAGVFGGIHSGVSADTKDIFLESAHFNLTSVRKSSVWHNLRTDAARVFEKGSDPSITVYALKRAALLFKEYADGTISSKISDELASGIEQNSIKLRLAQLHKLVGVEIPEDDVLMILEALDMEVVDRQPDMIEITVPTSKTDVTREADVIEEILRIYGFNNIPTDQVMEIALDSGDRDMMLLYQSKVSSILSGMGFNEAMGLSFALPQYLPIQENSAYVRINNTSNKDLEILRPDLISSALATVEYNQKRQNDALSFYEFGRSYHFVGEEFREDNHLAITITGSKQTGNWVLQDPPSGFYYIKSVVMRVLDAFNITGIQQSELDAPEYLFGLHLHRGRQTLAKFGLLDLDRYPDVDSRHDIFFADISWADLVRIAKPVEGLEPISRYPTVERDLALIVSSGVTFDDIRKEIGRIGGKLVREVSLFDVYEDETHLGSGNKSYGVKILFSDPDKTLKDKEIDKKVSKILDNLQKKWGVTLR